MSLTDVPMAIEAIPWTDVTGWGVVILVMRWMMTRMDRLIDTSNENMKSVIAEFRAFREQELEQHSRLEDQHERMEQKQAEILAHLARRRGG